MLSNPFKFLRLFWSQITSYNSETVSFLAKKDLIGALTNLVSFTINISLTPDVNQTLIEPMVNVLLIPSAVLAIHVCSDKLHRNYLIPFVFVLLSDIASKIVIAAHNVKDMNSCNQSGIIENLIELLITGILDVFNVVMCCRLFHHFAEKQEIPQL